MFSIKSCYISTDNKSVFYVADTSYHLKDDLIQYQYIIEYHDIYTEYPKLLILTPDVYKTLCSYFGKYEESSYDRYTVFNKLSKLREEFRYQKDSKYSALTELVYSPIFLNNSKSDILHSVLDALIDKVELKE